MVFIIFVLCASLHMEAFAEPSFATLNYALYNRLYIYIVISSIMVVFPVYTSLFDECSFVLVQWLPVRAINILYCPVGVWARVLTMAANY